MVYNRIYLDNAATTCVDERVMTAMLPSFSQLYGNASNHIIMALMQRKFLKIQDKWIAN